MRTPAPKKDPAVKAAEDLVMRQVEMAIAQHLQKHGRKKWREVREHPDFVHLVGKRAGEAGKKRFDRAKRRVLEIPAEDRTRPHQGREAAEANHKAAVENVEDRTSRGLPRTAAEATWMRRGADEARSIDLEEMLSTACNSIEDLRREAYEPDPDVPGQLRIKDAAQLDKSAARTLAYVEAALRLKREIAEAKLVEQYQKRFLEAALRVVAPHPELLEQLKTEVRALNQEYSSIPYVGAART